MAPRVETIVVALVLLGCCVLIFYRFILWVMEAPRTADPWEKETQDALNQPEAVPLCHHCFTPQEHNGWFCPECGSTVGPYCNYLPFVYVFSQGEVLRAGVTERLRHSPLIVIGFILFSLIIFAPIAPLYWIFLFKNLHERSNPKTEIPPLQA